MPDLPQSPQWPVAELTRRMKESDELAWREFHRRYFARLFAYLTVLLRSDDDTAAECVQLASLRVVRHIRVFDDEQRFWNWLACLAKCAAYDHLRGNKRRLAILEKYGHWKEIQRSGSEFGYSRPSAFADALETCLGSLPREDRQLLEGKYVECLTYAELASAHQLTEKTIENRLARLRRRLRECLTREIRYVP